ncbi:hypothetical protein [Nonlabens antarcticus]|uniref:hypothetical protein n=1 Tax=Nonlabens antarcticus TaxID=392714 RepID=UPI001890BA11|nr:hypothetical protein [Nonlabens antarcticus]
MEQPHNDNHRDEQEVDLVPVFVWIGNGVKGFFNAIGAFFKAIGHGIILFLIFLQKNIILIGIFLILGLALGYYLDTENKTNYSAQLRVSPNFQSAAQLISNINYYNSLTEEKDYELLSQELGISKEEASGLKSFDIEPSFSDTELLIEYDRLARRTDTMALDNFTFDGFKDAKREIDYEFYEINAEASSRGVLEKISDRIVNVKETGGIKAARLVMVEGVRFNVDIKQAQLIELDSLIVAYQDMLKSNRPSGNSTNLYLGDRESSDKLMNLFKQKQALLYDLDVLRDDQYGSENTVNIESQYIVQGAIAKQYIKLKMLLVFFGIALLIAVIPLVWRFLKAYPKATR